MRLRLPRWMTSRRRDLAALYHEAITARGDAQFARADAITAQLRAAYFQRRRDAWLDNFVRADRRAWRAEMALAQASIDRDEAARHIGSLEGRVAWLTGELRDMTRSRDEFMDMVDRLRKQAEKKGRK